MTSAPETPPDDSGPEAIRRNFAAVASATDTPAPGDGCRLPAVNLSQPISTLARTVGMILRSAPIFRFGESLSTVDESGRIAGMTAERFTSWVENWLAFTRPAADAPKEESIGKDMAGKIMAADQFRFQLRELKAVSEVRLPVWTGEGGARRVELAAEGFDEATGLFTVNRIPYQDDMTDDEAWSVLGGIYQDFAWAEEGESRVCHRRSYSAQFAAMVGVYCHELFKEGTPRPMIVYNGNQSGAGKTLLMRLAIAAVHDVPGENGKPESESEFEKVLDTAAIERQHYLALDDLSNLRSQALNRFVTSPLHRCRLMHSQRMATVEKVTQVFVSGNRLILTKDLDRRSLVIDLKEPGDAATKFHKWEITEEWYRAPENRSRMLAALWALVRRWREAGMPTMTEHRRGSFVTWSGVIGGIVMSCGMSNPFAPRMAEDGGDEAGRALLIVLSRIAGELPLEPEKILRPDDILAQASDQDLLEAIVPPDKDPKKALGWVIRDLGLPRHLVDTQGRGFEFKRREITKGTGYVIRFL